MNSVDDLERNLQMKLNSAIYWIVRKLFVNGGIAFSNEQRRFEIHLNKNSPIVETTGQKLAHCLNFALCLTFHQQPLCQQEILRTYIQESRTGWRDVMFPKPGSPTVSQHESAIVLNENPGDRVPSVYLTPAFL